MIRTQSIPLTDKAITLATAVATLPWPTTALAGADITPWRSGSFAPREAWIEIKNVDDVAVTLDQLELAGHIAGGGGNTDWASFGLTTPYAITLQPGSVAYVKAPVDAAGALVDRWALVGTVTGTTPQVTVRAIPLEVWN